MRSLLLATTVALLSLTISAPASAHDYGDFMRSLQWHCERGDREACQLHHLYRECADGHHRACEEIERERYHDRDRWREPRREPDREHEHDRDHDHDRWRN